MPYPPIATGTRVRHRYLYSQTGTVVSSDGIGTIVVHLDGGGEAYLYPYEVTIIKEAQVATAQS